MSNQLKESNLQAAYQIKGFLKIKIVGWIRGMLVCDNSLPPAIALPGTLGILSSMRDLISFNVNESDGLVGRSQNQTGSYISKEKAVIWRMHIPVDHFNAPISNHAMQVLKALQTFSYQLLFKEQKGYQNLVTMFHVCTCDIFPYFSNWGHEQIGYELITILSGWMTCLPHLIIHFFFFASDLVHS